MITTKEVEGLASLLDKNYGFQRPVTQSTGYSLQEDPNAPPLSAPLNTESPAAAVHIPATVVDQTLGLPMPSLSKEARALQRLEQQQQQGAAKPKGNAIWAPEEVSRVGPTGAPAKKLVETPSSGSGGSTTTTTSGLIEPEHEVMYKQYLNAEDVYLGVDFTRDNSSALCEGVVVKVKLPKIATAKELTLDVENYAMVLKSTEYYLRAHLPQKVIANKAQAKWDAEKKVLTVTMTSDNKEKEVKVFA